MSKNSSGPDINYTAIGKRIHQRRVEFGLSTQKLATLAGVARYTIIRIEKGLPCTHKTLQKVRPVLRLFSDQMTRHSHDTAKFALHRAADARWSVSIPKAEYQKRLVDDDPIHVNEVAERKRLGELGFQPFFTSILDSELSEGVMSQGLMELYKPSWVDSHFGEEFVYCLRGSVLMTVDGVSCTLEEGDGMCFDAHLPHQYQPAEPVGGKVPPPLILMVVAMTESERKKRRG